MILERDSELTKLAGLVDDLDSSGGRVVLLRGEAGIGKSALVTEFVGGIEDRAHVLEGACDDLLTPQPFGPIWDVARVESSVAASLAAENRRGVMEALLDLLSRRLRPTVLVLEDTQWADEATLDVIRFLGRRISRSNGVLILTYRVGEVDADHPLRQVIGELPPRSLVRMSLDHLSAAAVASLIADAPLDLDEVLALTGGNPLFVTEVAASGVDRVPLSIQDSVLARASKVSSGARRVLDLVSIFPGESERMLIDEILDPKDEHLTECERHGLLGIDDASVSFRHELTRRAVEAALSPSERRRLNERVLTALVGHGDPSRLVHHARQADDVDAIVEFAPKAARAAMGIESHREARAHFHALEPHLDRIEIADRAELLDDWARSEYLEGNIEAVDIVARAIALHRSLSDDRALARTLAFAVRVYEVNGRPEEAEACSIEAVEILESYPPSADLAFAVGQRAWLGLMQGVETEGSRLADQAIAIAEAVNDELTMIRALVVKGACDYSLGHLDAVRLVEEGHRRAEQGGYRFEEADALVNLTGMAGDVRDMKRAIDLARRTRETAGRYEIRPLEAYAQAQYAELLLWKGDWAAAEDAATEALGTDVHAEVVVWRLLGIIQARRGRSEARVALDRMSSLADASGEMQHLDPAATAMAEYMWLSGEDDPDRIARLREVLDRGMEIGPPWPSGAFAFWLWKLGLFHEIPEWLSKFYRMTMTGDWEAGAQFWETRSVPYEQAMALMHGDEGAQMQALRILEDLGASAAAARVRRALLDSGVKVSRGTSRSTREHSAGLTARQAEVLDLLAEGLSNSEIADRLFVSYRTVENHVAAVLMKLEVSTRDAAVDEARDRGILPDG